METIWMFEIYQTYLKWIKMERIYSLYRKKTMTNFIIKVIWKIIHFLGISISLIYWMEKRQIQMNWQVKVVHWRFKSKPPRMKKLMIHFLNIICCKFHYNWIVVCFMLSNYY